MQCLEAFHKEDILRVRCDLDQFCQSFIRVEADADGHHGDIQGFEIVGFVDRQWAVEWKSVSGLLAALLGNYVNLCYSML